VLGFHDTPSFAQRCGFKNLNFQHFTAENPKPMAGYQSAFLTPKIIQPASYFYCEIIQARMRGFCIKIYFFGRGIHFFISPRNLPDFYSKYPPTFRIV
jgi:hypothetical protein